MEGDTKEKMCHVPPSPLTQRLGSALTLVPRSSSEHQHTGPTTVLLRHFVYSFCGAVKKPSCELQYTLFTLHQENSIFLNAS